MVRLPPVTDLIDLVLAVVDDPAVRSRDGSTIVLVPSIGWAERLTARLRRRGCPATGSWEEARAGWPVVVGSRAGAWAPVPRLAAAVVLDAHDAAYREETTPTYSAVDVLVERARREGSRCLLASPVPPVRLAADMGLRRVRPPAHEERIGWSTLERVDRRGADPRTGMFSEEFVRLARAVLGDPTAAARGPLVCVYNRTGGARLLACRHCGELARCTRCGAAAARPRDEEVLVCPRCAETRPLVCVACGRLRMKTLRAGRESSGRGVGGAPWGRGRAGGRAPWRRRGPPPSDSRAGGNRGGAAPGTPRRCGGLLRHRSPPAGRTALGDRGHTGPPGPCRRGWSGRVAAVRRGRVSRCRPGCPSTRC